MRLEHHLVGGYVRYISPYIIIIINKITFMKIATEYKDNHIIKYPIKYGNPHYW